MAAVYLWLIITTVGLLFALYDLWDAQVDVRVLEAVGIHDRRLAAAKRDVRAQTFTSLTLITWEVTGLLALQSSHARQFIAPLLILSAALVSTNSVLERLSRKRILDMVRHERKQLLRSFRHGQDEDPPESLQDRSESLEGSGGTHLPPS